MFLLLKSKDRIDKEVMDQLDFRKPREEFEKVIEEHKLEKQYMVLKLTTEVEVKVISLGLGKEYTVQL